MEGLITSFRRGVRTQKKYQMIARVNGIENAEKARSLINKKVTWKSTAGKEIKGEITNLHGNKGKVRIQFETGLPGQSLGTKIQIV
ncbi:50S ribosomal protein L35ae [Candidatus Woesearchaeota archaeon]|nr:50S ribosomal protein L35ae [Candidatus Woesearchaeota archaeon]